MADYHYEIYLDGNEISCDYGYDSAHEAESEGYFAISTYADCYDRREGDFELKVRGPGIETDPEEMLAVLKSAGCDLSRKAISSILGTGRDDF